VALSITEAEYMAVVEVSKEALWLRGLVKTFDSGQIHCDNQSAIHLSMDHRYHKRMKHINVSITTYVSGS